MKTKSNRLWPVVIILFASAFVLYACQKESSFNNGTTIPNGQQKISVVLVDGPLDFQKVLVDIQQVAVKIDTCRRNHDEDHDGPGCDNDHDLIGTHCEYWDTLKIKAGVYDLLTLRNGVDSLMASGFAVAGKIQRIKLTLGDNNSVVVDNTSYPLHLINNQHFVFVNIHRDHLDSLSSNNFQLFLDFDLSRSIKLINGEYWLKPFLKPFGRHSSGEIEGKVKPVLAYSMIYATNGTDTAYARPDLNEGEFKIRGLHDGTYSLFIDGINGYKDSTINGLQVKRGTETRIGTIVLHQ